MIGILTIFAFSLGNKLYSVTVGRTMAFFTLSALELIHSFNIKSEESIWKVGIWNNWYLIGAFVIGILLQTFVIVIPALSNIFHTVPLTIKQWLAIIGISILPILIIEMQKKMNEIQFGKVIYHKREFVKER